MSFNCPVFTFRKISSFKVVTIAKLIYRFNALKLDKFRNCQANNIVH